MLVALTKKSDTKVGKKRMTMYFDVSIERGRQSINWKKKNSMKNSVLKKECSIDSQRQTILCDLFAFQWGEREKKWTRTREKTYSWTELGDSFIFIWQESAKKRKNVNKNNVERKGSQATDSILSFSNSIFELFWFVAPFAGHLFQNTVITHNVEWDCWKLHCKTQHC